MKYKNTISTTFLRYLVPVSFLLLSALTFSVPQQEHQALALLSKTAIVPVANVNSTTPLLTFQNSTLGIKIQYPSNWNKIDHSHNASIPVGAVKFVPPQEKNVNVLVNVNQGIPKNATLERFIIGDLTFIKNRFINFQLLESRPSSLAGNPAHILVFQYSNFLPQLNTLKAMTIVTVKGDKAYSLSYDAEMSKYNTYLPSVQKMINSTQIT
jgi:eukaryotic-like serine/threonine-protein kinase